MTYQLSPRAIGGLKYLNLAQAALDCALKSGRDVCFTIGPFAASKSDGTEYKARYGRQDEARLRKYYQEVLQAAQTLHGWSDVKYLAFETLSDKTEASIVLNVLAELGLPDKHAWISFSCAEEADVEYVIGLISAIIIDASRSHGILWGLGVNCFKPEFGTRLAAELAPIVSSADLVLILYPDAGQQWDACSRSWSGEAMPPDEWAATISGWKVHIAGPVLLGGCCRTTPAHIARLHKSRQ
ncbi:hypothetical protein PYCC9005_006061 [Savitreella phatthalungensis]